MKKGKKRKKYAQTDEDIRKFVDIFYGYYHEIRLCLCLNTPLSRRMFASWLSFELRESFQHIIFNDYRRHRYIRRLTRIMKCSFCLKSLYLSFVSFNATKRIITL